MTELDDMFSDPEPLDDDDVGLRQEIFEIHRSMGIKPEDLNESDEIRKEYAEWLKQQEP